MIQKFVTSFIGTRHPTSEQIQLVHEHIDELDPEMDVVVSGCAFGIDAEALSYAQSKGFFTIGVVPWKSYNLKVQKFCSKIIVLPELPEEDRKAAYASVREFHPSRYLSGTVSALHARNYIIVRNAKHCFAFPGNAPSGGGTGQGIRICVGRAIPRTVYDSKGQLLSSESVELLYSKG